MATDANSFDYRPFESNVRRDETLKQTLARNNPNLRPHLTHDAKFSIAALGLSVRNLKPGHDCAARHQSDVKLCVAWWLGDVSENWRTYWCLIREVIEPQDVLGQKLALERLLWTKMSHPGLRRCLHQSFDRVKNSSVYLFEYSATSLLAELHKRAHGAQPAPRPLLRESEVKQLVAGLVSAVDYLHAHNVIVRECALHPAHVIYFDAGRESAFALENGLLCLRDLACATLEREEALRDMDPYLLMYDRNYNKWTWNNVRDEALAAKRRLLKMLVKLVHFVVTYMDEDGKGDLDFLMPSRSDDWENLAMVIVEKCPSLSMFEKICSSPYFRADARTPETWTFASVFGDLISAPPLHASAQSVTQPV